MMIKKFVLLIVTIIIACIVLSVICVQAQDWAAMPPYNLLWPLWADVYSPPDPVTGIPTPLLDQVTSSTILPVQPIYLWNPYGYEFPMGFIQPWLLYNSPFGVLYYDTVFGLNPFPPQDLLDPASGLPTPIALPLNFSTLAIPSLGLALYTFELGNASYLTAFGNNLGVSPASLLTYFDVYGTPDVLEFLRPGDLCAQSMGEKVYKKFERKAIGREIHTMEEITKNKHTKERR